MNQAGGVGCRMKCETATGRISPRDSSIPSRVVPIFSLSDVMGIPALVMTSHLSQTEQYLWSKTLHRFSKHVRTFPTCPKLPDQWHFVIGSQSKFCQPGLVTVSSGNLGRAEPPQCSNHRVQTTWPDVAYNSRGGRNRILNAKSRNLFRPWGRIWPNWSERGGVFRWFALGKEGTGTCTDSALLTPCMTCVLSRKSWKLSKSHSNLSKSKTAAQVLVHYTRPVQVPLPHQNVCVSTVLLFQQSRKELHQ